MNNKELEECSFNPQIIPLHENHRTLAEFLEDQSKFLKRKREMPSHISEEKVEQMPTINKNSSILANKQPRTEPIYNRLYSIARKTVKEEEIKPKTRAKTRERRELRLYQLAFDKSKKSKEHIEEKKFEHKSNINPFIERVFKKEFNKAIEELKLENNKINYEAFITFMKTMRFMQDNPTTKLTELINKLWNSLTFPNKDLAAIDLLETYTAAILHINQKNTSIDLNKIATEYEMLYINRISNGPKKELKATENLSFMPSLCKESMRIAKSKYMSNQDSFKPSSDSLLNITEV